MSIKTSPDSYNVCNIGPKTILMHIIYYKMLHEFLISLSIVWRWFIYQIYVKMHSHNWFPYSAGYVIYAIAWIRECSGDASNVFYMMKRYDTGDFIRQYIWPNTSYLSGPTHIIKQPWEAAITSKVGLTLSVSYSTLTPVVIKWLTTYIY